MPLTIPSPLWSTPGPSLRPRSAATALSSAARRTRCHPTLPRSQQRAATFLARPKRPYTFTQLVQLSDGSTYLHRTTSPAPAYRSTKDARNTPLWNPSSQSLLSVEADDAGRLRAFRDKFGRGWDARTAAQAAAAQAPPASAELAGEAPQEMRGTERLQDEGEGEEESLMDLITGFEGAQDRKAMKGAGENRSGKRRKGK